MERVRAVVAWLEARPLLGRDTYARGAPEAVTRRVAPDVYALFEACLVGLRWMPPARQIYAPPRPILWRVSDAIARLRALIGSVADGADLTRFLPPHLFPLSRAGDEALRASVAGRVDLPLQRR
jgi:segregation and condensation protein A